MRQRDQAGSRLWRAWWAGIAAAAALWCGPAAAASAPVVVLTLEGAVSPATADYVARGIQRAADDGARLVVLKMDTPGGLDTSMRQIIKAILSSTVPVATFVAPSGARAASAGTYILYASHIAAMAPATNLGAATPVQIGIGGPPDDGGKAKPAAEDKPAEGKDKKDKSAAKKPKKEEAPQGDLKAKQIHDAAAYIRGLAQLRGRNAEWGERAVREAVSLSAEEAQKIKVVDLIATDVTDLLAKIDGRKVTVQGVERKLETKGAEFVAIDPDWRSELLAVITNPSVALILMMIGIYGLIFEFSNPGFVVPGVVGGICLLLALYAFQLLPVNYAGLGLILLGLAFIVAEAFLPSFGALGIGGAIAVIIGSVILIEPGAGGQFAVPLPFIVTLGLTTSAIVFAIVGMAVKARGRAIVSGVEDMTGAPGEMLEDMRDGEGWARVRGENWRVVSRAPLARGQKVRVTRVEGLTLSVEPESKTTQGAES